MPLIVYKAACTAAKASQISFELVKGCSKMRTTLILLVIGIAILFAEAQNDYYRPPSCGRCDFRDFKGKRGPPGPEVY